MGSLKVAGEISQLEKIADNLILSHSKNDSKEELKNDMPVYIVGDAKEVGNAQDVIQGAYEQAINL